MTQTKLITCLLIILFTACQRDALTYNINEPGGTPVSSIIAIKSLSASQVAADSATTCEIMVQINPNTDSVSRPVIFKTSNGSFPNRQMTDTLTPDAFGVVTAFVISNSPGPAEISANLQSYIVDTLIEFVPAFPDNLMMASSKYTGSPTDTFVVSCQVFRDTGKVSNPIMIDFRQRPAAAAGQGLIFASFANTSAGMATVTVYNPYQVAGTISVGASTTAKNGSTLTDSVTLVIK